MMGEAAYTLASFSLLYWNVQGKLPLYIYKSFIQITVVEALRST